MLDDELMEILSQDLPEDLPHVFISAVSGYGIQELKDVLWKAINDESNRIAPNSITHRPLDGHHRVKEEDEFIFETSDSKADNIDDELYDYDDDDDDFGNSDRDWEYGIDDN